MIKILIKIKSFKKNSADQNKGLIKKKSSFRPTPRRARRARAAGSRLAAAATAPLGVPSGKDGLG